MCADRDGINVSDTYTETADATALSRARDGHEEVPGVLLVFSAGEPLHGVLHLERGGLDIGRGSLAKVELRDACMSRHHASIRRSGDTWTVIDHGSRNGTHVDGERIKQQVTAKDFSVVRVGETLFLLCPDLTPFVGRQVEVREGVVVGPRLDALLAQVMRAANAGVLHITGETGAGKEIVARFFHRLGAGPAEPFVAVNGAAIPEGVAERLLFGTKRGAFSGASADAVGYIEEANGGTLFLDEVGELDLNVQAKLLRVLETREVLPLGATRPRRVDIRVCSATHVDLREAVAAGRFRGDLFYRLGRPRVALPPLRQRREEIPHLIDRQLRACDDKLIAQAALVESCLLRTWPGNVRELLAELRDAAFEAQTAGKHVVRLSDMASDAGASYETSPPDSVEKPNVRAFPEREEVERVLRECQGRVATAARALGVHRTQLRRFLERNRADAVAAHAAGVVKGPTTSESWGLRARALARATSVPCFQPVSSVIVVSSPGANDGRVRCTRRLDGSNFPCERPSLRRSRGGASGSTRARMAKLRRDGTRVAHGGTHDQPNLLANHSPSSPRCRKPRCGMLHRLRRRRRRHRASKGHWRFERGRCRRHREHQHGRLEEHGGLRSESNRRHGRYGRRGGQRRQRR